MCHPQFDVCAPSPRETGIFSGVFEAERMCAHLAAHLHRDAFNCVKRPTACLLASLGSSRVPCRDLQNVKLVLETVITVIWSAKHLSSRKKGIPPAVSFGSQARSRPRKHSPSSQRAWQTLDCIPFAQPARGRAMRISNPCFCRHEPISLSDSPHHNRRRMPQLALLQIGDAVSEGSRRYYLHILHLETV